MSIVERLIAGTTMPAPLPGLEVRLVPPEQRAVAEPRTPPDSPSPPPAREEVHQETPDRTPPLDLDALADKVYQTLKRRQQFEQERRGLY
jgi:hypothetical protein